MRLLVVEDEIHLNQILTKRLTKEGFSVDSCYDGEEALDFLEVGEFDGIIMDIMMPKVDGLTVLKTLRAQKNQTPVLLLTAKDAVSDRVIGLDAGAEDYLIKPFAFEELLARIRVMLRKRAGESTNHLEVGDLVLNIDAKTAHRAGQEIALTSKEYDLLEYLMINKGIVLSRDKIENHLWNFDYTGGTNVIDVYIWYLRKKIDDPFEKKLIHTIRGKGYVIKEAPEDA